MIGLQKSYRYSIYRNGTYLGDLPTPSSDFTYSQDINAAGAQIQITIPVSADTADQPNAQLTDESGAALTDESGNPLWTDGTPPIVGSMALGVLVAASNSIFVYEYSSTYPNGKLMYAGYITDWEADFGGTDDELVTVTCMSNGEDLANYPVIGGFTEQIIQDTQDNSLAIITGSPQQQLFAVGNTFVPGSSYSVGKIVVGVSIDSSSTPPCTLQLTLASTTGGVANMVTLGTATATIVNTSVQEVSFVFATPIVVNSGSNYFFYVAPVSGNIDVFYKSSQPLGTMFLLVVGSWLASIPGSVQFQVWSQSAQLTQTTFTSTDPTTILRNVITDYAGVGGNVNYTNASTVLTGLLATYTFQVNSIIEAIQACLQLAGGNYYWYVDLATQTIFFQPTATTPTWVFTKGKHLTSIKMKGTIVNIKNVIYFTGALIGGNNLFIGYTNSASIAAANGVVGMDRLSDSNVSDQATARILAQSDSKQHPGEEYQTKITVLDQTMDITLPRVGDTVAFSGFGSFIDTILLQIISLEYHPEYIVLTLGTKPPRTASTVQNVKNQLLQLQQVANGTLPVTVT